MDSLKQRRSLVRSVTRDLCVPRRRRRCFLHKLFFLALRLIKLKLSQAPVVGVVGCESSSNIHSSLGRSRSHQRAENEPKFLTFAQVCLNKAKHFMYEKQYTKLCIMNENECVYEAPPAVDERSSKVFSFPSPPRSTPARSATKIHFTNYNLHSCIFFLLHIHR